MIPTYANPSWVALARSAAAQLGASHDSIIAAILSQWTCEQGNPAPWPPALNNPGNLTSAIGSLDGQPHSVGRYIGPSAYLYRYATPQAGALAYANYLLRSPRYTKALASARAGDATGFLANVCNAGYGTRLSCALGILAHVQISTPQAPAVPHWVCLANAVNVRRGPGTGYAIVGTEHSGAVIQASVVNGGAYHANGRTYSSWLQLGPGRFSARAFYRQR